MGDWLQRFDGQIEVTPPVGNEQLAEVPSRRGIFALLGERDIPIVVLTAANIRARVGGRLSEPMDEVRRKTVDLRAITRKVLWKLTSSGFETDWVYLRTVREIFPDQFESWISWKRPWLVEVDPRETHPHFARTRNLSETKRQFGPFPTGRDAEQFIDILCDAFKLCRDTRCLRQAPHGQPCSYAQMGRCLRACDGTISMDAYREQVNKAADFAAGVRQEHLDALNRQMREAAGALAFEQAAGFKKRLERLGALEGPAYRWASPLERFRFILVQRGRSFRQAKVFLADRGSLIETDPLEYPLQSEQLAGLLRLMESSSTWSAQWNDPLQMGLLCNYLFGNAERRGLMLRWEPSLTTERLAWMVENAREGLKLRCPKPRKKKAPDPPKEADK